MNENLVVLVTAKDKAEARRIAKRLFQKKLIACVNFIPIESMYVWDGEVQEEEEVLMVIKTRTDAFDEVATNVRIAHSYDTPEIIALPVLLGSREYLKWIENVVKA
jgi:periplasmic divalent cation tolerance protein